MNYNYNVSATYPNARVIVETNDVGIAIEEFFERVEDGAFVDIINGFTGEVLVHCVEDPEQTFATDEWELMLLGWLTTHPEVTLDDLDTDLTDCVTALILAE